MNMCGKPSMVNLVCKQSETKWYWSSDNILCCLHAVR